MLKAANQDEIDAHKKAQKDRILSNYANSEDRVAKSLTKDEFEKTYTTDKFEIYSLSALDNFRKDLMKADGVDDKDAAFKAATADLRPVVVYSNGKRGLFYVKEKEEAQ